MYIVLIFVLTIYIDLKRKITDLVNAKLCKDVVKWGIYTTIQTIEVIFYLLFLWHRVYYFLLSLRGVNLQDVTMNNTI